MRSEKTGAVLRKAGEIVFITAVVICVAAVWRLALQQENPGENAEVLETEDFLEVSAVFYRLNEDAYILINPEKEEPFDFAWVEEKEIYGEDGEHIAEADLDTGDEIKALVSGGFLETYPGAWEKALRIDVTKKADAAAKEACRQKYQAMISEFYTEQDPAEPPSLQLSYTEGEMASCIAATQGGYQWSRELADGQSETMIADTAFITEWPYLAEADLSEAEGEIEILPGKEDSSLVTVTCWPEEIKGMEDIPEGEDIPTVCRDGSWYFTEVKAGYYYLVRVCWGNDYVEYGFLSK